VQDRLAEEILAGRVSDGQTVVVDGGDSGLFLRAAGVEQPGIDAAA
jgi:ATP-dependent Clp protease ATP-binding subunit ClpB